MMECVICEQSMIAADSCSPDRVIERADGTTRAPVLYGSESRWEQVDFDAPSGDDRCHDCGVSAGAPHHPGCDMEECPFCGGQYLACPCRTNDDGERLVTQDWFEPDDPVGSLGRAKDDEKEGDER